MTEFSQFPLAACTMYHVNMKVFSLLILHRHFTLILNYALQFTFMHLTKAFLSFLHCIEGTHFKFLFSLGIKVNASTKLY